MRQKYPVPVRRETADRHLLIKLYLVGFLLVAPGSVASPVDLAHTIDILSLSGGIDDLDLTTDRLGLVSRNAGGILRFYRNDRDPVGIEIHRRFLHDLVMTTRDHGQRKGRDKRQND